MSAGAAPGAARVRVLALGAQGPSEPSFRIRVASMSEPLARLGIELDIRTLFSDEHARRFDSAGLAGKVGIALGARRRMRTVPDVGTERWQTTLVHRRVDLFPGLALERSSARGRRLVYDVDDAIWLDARREGSHPLAILKDSARKVRWLSARADAVIAGNELLAEHLRRYSSNVSVVPSVVDTDTIEIRQHEDGPEGVVGWIGSPTTAPFLARVREPLERVAGARAGRRQRLLVVGGSGAAPAGFDHEEVSWTARAERAALARIDVGIMPLPDNPWNRGKCAYKAILYMAAGIPVVADDVGVTREVVGPGGIVVTDREEWVDALVSLLSDPGLRSRIGAAGRQRVVERYSTARWAPEIARILHI